MKQEILVVMLEACDFSHERFTISSNYKLTLITVRLNLQKTTMTLSHQSQHFPNGRCSIYNCSQGLVIDFCVQIPIESIRDFISKWNLSIENDG